MSKSWTITEDAMPRPVILFTNGWTDTPLDHLAGKAAEWGYAGLELACWGDHFEVQRALTEADYVSSRTDLLAGHDLQGFPVGVGAPGQHARAGGPLRQPALQCPDLIFVPFHEALL